MKTYELKLICEYEQQKEVHSLYVGNLNQCRAIKVVAKIKEKQFRKHESIPKNAKMTYKIERVKNIDNK